MENNTPEAGNILEEKLLNWQRHIRLFIKDSWNLTVQMPKPEYRDKLREMELASYETWERMKQEVKPEWYGDYDEEKKEWKWYNFEKGKHITWQQNLILMGIEKAISKDAKSHLSISSGHGIGKSATVAWVTLWYLYCFKESQVPVTAPTAMQMHDVLWKEISIWISKMPEKIKKSYIWTADHVRVSTKPESWFARARTSTKENTEALAGVHADHVSVLVDEASGVPEQVYNTAEGALTSGDVLVILISNPTRLDGYFYDSHHKNKSDWQIFKFNCEHSPIVDKTYVERQEKRHGRDSDEFRIRVLGDFPMEEAMDDSGYVQLVNEGKITIEPSPKDDTTLFLGKRILGVDPSGEGKDTATFAIRDRFKGKIVKKLKTTNPRQIAQVVLTLMDRYMVKPEDVVIDAFGVGADVSKEIALASQGKYDCYSVLVGNNPKYEEEYNHSFFLKT